VSGSGRVRAWLWPSSSYRDEPGAKLDADRQVVNVLEPLVRELQQQARLAHPTVADDNVLEEVVHVGSSWSWLTVTD